jgi:predicted MPP superfamily phosphohydrolase
MKIAQPHKVKLSEKISSVVGSETPLRDLASNFSLIARSALNEANSLTVETISIQLKRLPKKLEGFRFVHLSDVHHSPFTSLEHITRAVDISNSLKPDMFVLTGDFVSHEIEYIEPVAKVLGTLESEFGTFACLGNHDHWTDAELSQSICATLISKF